MRHAAPGSHGKRLAVLPSSYVPTRSYFDLVNSVDHCIIDDHVAYAAKERRNRNRVKGFSGAQWLTIPVELSDSAAQPTYEVQVADRQWWRQHWRSISRCYTTAPYFHRYAAWLESLYRRPSYELLVDVNFHFILALCEAIGIKTRIESSRDYGVSGDAGARLIELCRRTGATQFVSHGNRCQSLDEQQLASAGIEIEYQDDADYPIYHQLFGEFDDRLSLLDLLLCEGPHATRYMKSFRSSGQLKAA